MLYIVTQFGHEANNAIVYAMAGIVIAVAIAFYVLRSIGVFVMAKRRKIKSKYLAFVPLLWIYPVCKLIGEVGFFGSTFGKMAWLVCLVFTLAGLMNAVSDALVYYPLVGNFLLGRPLFLVIDPSVNTEAMGWAPFWLYGSGIYVDESFVYPYSNILAMENFLSVFSLITMLFGAVSEILAIYVYVRFFRKYYPQHFILAAVLSFMGLFAPFAFAIRHNDAVNYADYVRARMGNPYGFYGTGGNVNRTPPPDYPFEEFAGRGEKDPGDPFSEFPDKKDDKGGGDGK